MQFSCALDGALMRCRITADADMAAPVFCFSLLAPPAVTAGGTLTRSDGGYGEVQLPDLQAGVAHDVVLRYADPAYRPANRAWLPLGPYLRHAGGCTALPALPAGAAKWTGADQHAYEGLRLLPQPQGWTPTDGRMAVTGLSVSDNAFDAANGLAGRMGLRPLLAQDGTQVMLQHNDDLPPDAYRIDITPKTITVSASDYGGRFYAAVTLLTLLNTHDGLLPHGQITDAPRFAWRGQHLDCARHFYQPATLHRLLDIMALCKLNRFHWHFADDEAFRLQLDSLPALWQRTEMRGEGELIPGVFGGGPHAGGSYSKADVAALIAHARRLNIEVMPEIEVPAHALALTRVYPETRDPNDSGNEASVQGYRANVMNPAMPRTWDILHTLVDEVTALFPFPYLHLGCDELPADTWMGSPAARALMVREGLETTKDLQGWMMAKLATYVAAKGVRPVAWEEAAQGSNGGIGHDALLFSWSGQAPGLAAAQAGYDVVMCPAQHVYLDMAQTDDPNDWGANWAAYINLSDMIAWDPVPEKATALSERIMGVQGAFWSEFTTQDDELWPMILPRILGVATMAWAARRSTGTDTLKVLAAIYQRAIFDRY